MSEKNYPPLPEHVDENLHTGAYLYTEAQMRAYVDADRAQRLPLTDEQCDAIAEALDDWALSVSYGNLGLPLASEGWRDVIREALNPKDPS